MTFHLVLQTKNIFVYFIFIRQDTSQKVATARERVEKTWLILMIHSKDMRLCTHASVCVCANVKRNNTVKG